MDINISIIDWIGVIDDGISVLLSLLIDTDNYEIVYWFNKNNEIKINVDDTFLNKYNIKNIYELPNIEYLIKYIDDFIIKDKQKIYSEFNI